MPTPTDSPRSPDALKLRIAELQLEHRGLDQMIRLLTQPANESVHAAAARPAPVPAGLDDELALRRLKKRKLQIKDTIVLLQMQLTPDVPA